MDDLVLAGRMPAGENGGAPVSHSSRSEQWHFVGARSMKWNLDSIRPTKIYDLPINLYYNLNSLKYIFRKVIEVGDFYNHKIKFLWVWFKEMKFSLAFLRVITRILDFVIRWKSLYLNFVINQIFMNFVYIISYLFV